MARRSGYGFAVAAAAVGCSLVTPLDYVGGTVESSGGRGSAAGSGGSTGGLAGSGGTNPEGGTGEGALGGDAGGGRGGMSGSGPAGAGGRNPEGGAGGDAGEGGLGESGSGGSGNVGGVAGGGMSGTAGSAGGGGCAGADLVSDPTHCGACDTVCGAAEYCIQGECIESPCDGLCPTFVTVPLAGDGFRMDAIGTTEQCYEVVGYERPSDPAALICWNFVPERTLEVNGTSIECKPEGVSLGAERAGGYCLKAGSGDHDYAGFKFPLP